MSIYELITHPAISFCEMCGGCLPSRYYNRIDKVLFDLITTFIHSNMSVGTGILQVGFILHISFWVGRSISWISPSTLYYMS